MNDFLTELEIEDLTGAKQVSKQKEILSKNKIFFVERTDGKIKVCWHHVHNPMVEKQSDTDALINWNAA
tara:strand:+ start:12519 stop:12725 length:207 start_codon:yes stop_codon:yes gene_type:complete